MNQNDKQGASAICVFTLWVCRLLRQASNIGLSQTPQGLYLNVKLTSLEQIGTTWLENVESEAQGPDMEERSMLPFAGALSPSFRKSKFSSSHLAFTIHWFIRVRVLPTYSPRPYPAVLLTTRTDVATPNGFGQGDSPPMQPVTRPGELPLPVSLRFSKVKVKSPAEQEVVVLKVEVVAVVLVVVVVVVLV